MLACKPNVDLLKVNVCTYISVNNVFSCNCLPSFLQYLGVHSVTLIIAEPKPHESLSKKESSEYEDAGFRYRPKPFCLQNPNRFQYKSEAASQADTNSIRVVPCRSASARPRLQSQHSSQGSITSSRAYLPNRSYEISYAISLQQHDDRDKQVMFHSPLAHNISITAKSTSS